MKTKILFFCIALGVLFASTAHSSTTCSQMNTESNSWIPLEGRCQFDRWRFEPITVEQQNKILFTSFHKAIGTVQVTITDEYNITVFSETVDTDMQSILTISLMGLPSGSYVITLDTEYGKLRGIFEI